MELIHYILNIIGYASIGVIYISSEPTILLREWLFRKLYKGDYTVKWTWRLAECAMCITWHIYFWPILIIGLYNGNINFDIMGASICAIIAELIVKKLSKW